MTYDAIHLDDLDPKRNQKRALRQQILQRYGGRCVYCWDLPSVLTIDHLTPKSRGGHEGHWNKLPACPRCNGAKGSHEVIQWLRRQPFYSPEAEARVREWAV